MEYWGVVMRAHYNKHQSYRYSDLSVTHLTYWTDNGDSPCLHASQTRCHLSDDILHIFFAEYFH